jgi:gamma-glutamylcyclotransferase (GGCT)/AIG2-like uncharacterized protein YtfP
MRIAVYGSLRKGGKLNPIMLDNGAKFLGESSFEGQLYSLGAYPAAIPGSGTVHCEVWDCSDELIKRLDSVEGHPWMYRRTPIETANCGLVQVYFYQRRLHSWDRRIESGVYNVADWK